MIFGTVASSGAAHLKVTWDHLVRHRTEGRRRSAPERKLGWGLQASSLRTGRLAGDLCPTRLECKQEEGRKGVDSTYAALQRTAIDVVPVELANGHGSVFVCVHLDESKATVRLETGFGHVTEVLEKGNKVRLGSVRGKVADVAGSLPLSGLRHDHVVALDTVSREVMVTKGSGWGHAHRGHGLLLRNRRLALLVSPVAANGTRPKPFSVHGAESTLSIRAITECDEAVAAGPARLHVPHDAGFRHLAKHGEGLEKHLVVDFVGQIANKDVEVVRCVFLCGVVGLVSPVDADFLRLVKA